MGLPIGYDTFQEVLDKKLDFVDKSLFINEHTVFSDLTKDGETAVWNLLFMSGYLKAETQEFDGQDLKCYLNIPNYEVRNLYRQIIEQWLANGHGIDWYQNFLNNLLTGNIEGFKLDLRHIMEQTVSVHDTASDPEAFYHAR